MTPISFFQGRLVGWGVVCGFGGRVLRRFTITMEGQWAEEHRALHLDETYSYVGGETLNRRWAIHTDEQGVILGQDAIEVARLRGRQNGRDFRIVFDRPRHPGGSRSEPPVTVDFVEVDPDHAVMIGHAGVFGFKVARLHAMLNREL